MKKALSLLLITIACCTYFTSCNEQFVMDESVPIVPVLNPITAVTALDGGSPTSAMISNDDKTIILTFFDEKDLSNITLHFTFSPRTKLVSISDSIASFDLTQPQELVINNLYKDVTYTIYGIIPVKLPAGMREGSGTVIWSKKLDTDLNIDVLHLTGGIAATKDHLVINTRNKESIYVNGKTGMIEGYLNMNGVKGGLVNFYNTSDDAGNILLCNLAPNDASHGGAFKVWLIKGIADTPKPYITWAGGVTIGRKISIKGNVDEDAIITAPIMGAGNRFALWQVKEGVLLSQTPQLFTITGTSINWANNVDIISTSSTDPSSDLFVAYGNNPSMVSWVDGETKAIKTSSQPTSIMSNAVDNVVFNGTPYIIHNNLSKEGKDDTAFIYDVSSENGLDTPIWSLSKGTYGGTNNINATGDTLFKISENGYFLYVYILFTNGSVSCVQFDCIDFEGSLPN